MESSQIQRGIQLFQLGKYQDATKYFSEDLESFESRYYLALCYFQLDDYKKAQQLADGLLSENPDNDAIFFLKAQIAQVTDQHKEALSLINQAIEIDPYDPDYFGLKAGLLLQLKKYQEGLVMANEGLNLNPNHSFCLNMRAQLLTKLERIDDAGKTIQDILLDNPEDAYSHANVGWIALENNKIDKALSHFKEALQKDPNFEYARDGMSTALKSKNFIYSLYLKYSFWIAKKSGKSQWAIIIGIYLIYRFAYEFLIANDLTFLAIPLVIGYLLFALGSWIMEPMSNFILGFDSYGKYLLNENQKRSGLTFGLLFIVGLLSITLYYSLDIALLLTVAVAAAAAIIPLPRAFLLYSKKARLAGFITGGFILMIGVFGLLFVSNALAVASATFIVMIVYTWIGSIFE